MQSGCLAQHGELAADLVDQEALADFVFPEIYSGGHGDEGFYGFEADQDFAFGGSTADEHRRGFFTQRVGLSEAESDHGGGVLGGDPGVLVVAAEFGFHDPRMAIGLGNEFADDGEHDRSGRDRRRGGVLAFFPFTLWFGFVGHIGRS